MLLDFTTPWGIIRRSDGRRADAAADYAEAELSAILGRMTGVAPARADDSRESNILVLDSGSASPGPGGPRRERRFSWRAAPDRVELYGEDGPALVQAVYDFLRALGARWVAPGSSGERLPRGRRLELAASSGASSEGAAAALALGHGVFLEDWEARLAWAARAGYSSVIVLLTADPMALGAAPAGLYDRVRPGFIDLAGKAGLAIELGGVAGAASAAELAAAYPEASAFHAWPDELPGGGWRGSAPRPRSARAADSLAAAISLAEALSAARPGAALSFRADPDGRGLAAAVAAAAEARGGALPPGLELLWAPRGRPRDLALRDTEPGRSALASFGEAARAWREAGGGRISVLERWEDGLLYKCAVPPMPRSLSGDVAAYREAGAECVGVLAAGCRLPLAPRPNAYLVPALARAPGGLSSGHAGDSGAASAAAGAPAAADARSAVGEDPDRLLADWAAAAYGESAGPMLGYWRELEEAWIIAMDVAGEETGLRDSGEGLGISREPPADWGDPWKAGLERLAARRGRCEELFDRLRAAERALGEARSAAEGGAPAGAAVLAEADEYAISGAVLECECARLAAYHELAAGDERAAADVANLALSVSGVLKAALARLPDPRSRAEGRFLVGAFYELGLKAIRRANARSGPRRILDARLQAALAAIAAARVSRANAKRARRR